MNTFLKNRILNTISEPLLVFYLVVGYSTFKFLFRRFPTGFEVSPKMRLSCNTSRSLRLRTLKSSVARLA